MNLEPDHTLDCDGYVTTHSGHVRPLRSPGTDVVMHEAYCSRCDWHGSRVGPAAIDLARREAREHTQEIACDGRCARCECCRADWPYHNGRCAWCIEACDTQHVPQPVGA